MTPPTRGHPHQQQEGAPEPQEDHRHLEPRGHELPHPGDDRHHEQPDREHRPLLVAGAEAGHGDATGQEASRRAHQAEHHRGPLQRRPRGGGVDGGQGEHPQGVRVDLHPLPHVEDGAVAGQQIVDDAEVDEGVLVHPPVDPGPHQHDHQGHQHRPPRADYPREGRPAGGGACLGGHGTVGPRSGPGLGDPPACDGRDGSGGHPRAPVCAAPTSPTAAPGRGRGPVYHPGDGEWLPTARGACRRRPLAGARSAPPVTEGDGPAAPASPPLALRDGGGRRRPDPGRAAVGSPEGRPDHRALPVPAGEPASPHRHSGPRPLDRPRLPLELQDAAGHLDGPRRLLHPQRIPDHRHARQ